MSEEARLFPKTYLRDLLETFLYVALFLLVIYFTLEAAKNAKINNLLVDCMQ